MTRQEFYDKYGSVEVTFSSYYKYTFTYSAVLPDGKKLSVGFGGSHDDIYRHEVFAGKAESVLGLLPYTGSVLQNDEEIEGFYDF